MALNRIADSEPYLRKLVNNTPASGKSNTFLSISQRCVNRASDKALAADVVERALADDLADKDIGPLAWATVGHMRLLAGNKAGALDAVSRAQELKPDTGAIVLLALELIETGSPELEPMVQRYLDKSDSAQLRLVYAVFCLTSKGWSPPWCNCKRLRNQLLINLRLGLAGATAITGWKAGSSSRLTGSFE